MNHITEYIEGNVKKIKTLRLLEIDIARRVVLLGVAILHSGNGSSAQNLGGFLEHFYGFAAPFFLATSFYLAASKFYANKRYSLQAKLSCLLAPHEIWVLFYNIFAGLKYSVYERISWFPQVFQDSVSITFFGNPVYHLYFIPLLLICKVLLKGIESLDQKWISLKV